MNLAQGHKVPPRTESFPRMGDEPLDLEGRTSVQIVVPPYGG